MMPITRVGMVKNIFAISDKFDKELIIANPKISGTLTNAQQQAVPFDENMSQKKI